MLPTQLISVLNENPLLSDGIRHREVERLMETMSFDEAVKQTLRNFEARREAWLNSCIRPWAAKHGINEQQAISVLFFDNTKDGVRSEDCFWAEGNEFAQITRETTNEHPVCC